MEVDQNAPIAPRAEPAAPSRRPPIDGVAALIAVALILVAMTTTYRLELRRSSEALATEAVGALDLHLEVTRGWLGRFATLTSVYARNPDIVAMLRNGDRAQINLVNEKLELLNSATGAAATYVLDRRGVTVAASNWSDAISFIGNDYSFRPYYRMAIQGGLGRYFALGTSSNRRGYYFSYPVRDQNRVVGVVVVKAPVEAIEQELRGSGRQVFVTDDAGVVVIAGDPRLRMTTLGRLSETAAARIRRDRQFDISALRPAPIEGPLRADGGETVRARLDRSAAPTERMRHFTRRMAVEGWTLHLLIPVASSEAQARTAALLAGCVGFGLLMAGVALRQHRRRLMERLAERVAASAALERAVAERTADLKAVNLRLSAEVQERTEAEAKLRRTQSELVQAGKLAALGQMSTSLSHEFNQPLAAIRAYSENAIAFLERDQRAAVSDNLARIGRLTERMAELSKHLTSFARKPKDMVEPIALAQAIDQAIQLMQARIAQAEAEIAVEGVAGLRVMGGVTRLQHVFMNLIGNAIDAASARDRPVIAIRARVEGDETIVDVTDNGVGLSETVREKLFDPFFSTKETGKGLGLGLSISFNIVRDFGGSLRAENREDAEGARFQIRLRSAPAAEGMAAE